MSLVVCQIINILHQCQANVTHLKTSTELGALKGSGDTTFKTAAHGTTKTKVQGAWKTPDSFWNLKTRVFATWCFHTDHHHVQWCLEFSWNEAMVSATSHCSSGGIIKTKSVTVTQCGFSQHFQRCDALAAILWYGGDWNGIKKDQWRRVNHKDVHVQLVHLTMWSIYDEYMQVSLAAVSCTLLKWQQWLLNSPQGFALFSIYNPCWSGTWKTEKTRWTNYSSAMNSWTWWITITTQRAHYWRQTRLTSMSGYGNKQNCHY